MKLKLAKVTLLDGAVFSVPNAVVKLNLDGSLKAVSGPDIWFSAAQVRSVQRIDPSA